MIKLAFSYTLIFLLLAGIPGFSFASGNSNKDSLTPVIAARSKVNTNLVATNAALVNPADNLAEEDATLELERIEAGYAGKEKNRHTLLKLIRVMHVKKALHYTKSRQRLLADIAGVSARLRLYPFAMQCYYLSTVNADSTAIEEKPENETISLQDLSDPIDSGILTVSDDWKQASTPVSTEEIEQPFDDGKEAMACALLLHVKQPSPGKRKPFTGVNNVGHMFITLIKYNTDKSIVSKTFGFYPEKADVFDGTPLHPAAASVIKDDSFHAWDEAAGRFISYRRLQRILRLLDKFKNKKYHLNKNNCTDFGLYVAMIGGIDVENTKGFWPLGKGNNPGAAGQSLLEGKLKNTDTGTKAGLFLCNSNEPLAPVLKK